MRNLFRLTTAYRTLREPVCEGAPTLAFLCADCGTLTPYEPEARVPTHAYPICDCGARARIPHILNAAEPTYAYVIDGRKAQAEQDR